MLTGLVQNPLNSLIYVLLFSTALSTVCLKSQFSNYLKKITLISSLIALLIGLFLCVSFDKADGGFQFIYSIELLAQYNLSFALGVDGFSIVFIILTLFIFPICILSA
jgi:NADH-quinone oxidoreductase subunit M